MACSVRRIWSHVCVVVCVLVVVRRWGSDVRVSRSATQRTDVFCQKFCQTYAQKWMGRQTVQGLKIQAKPSDGRGCMCYLLGRTECLPADATPALAHISFGMTRYGYRVCPHWTMKNNNNGGGRYLLRSSGDCVKVWTDGNYLKAAQTWSATRLGGYWPPVDSLKNFHFALKTAGQADEAAAAERENAAKVDMSDVFVPRIENIKGKRRGKRIVMCSESCQLDLPGGGSSSVTSGTPTNQATQQVTDPVSSLKSITPTNQVTPEMTSPATLPSSRRHPESILEKNKLSDDLIGNLGEDFVQGRHPESILEKMKLLDLGEYFAQDTESSLVAKHDKLSRCEPSTSKLEKFNVDNLKNLSTGFDPQLASGLVDEQETYEFPRIEFKSPQERIVFFFGTCGYDHMLPLQPWDLQERELRIQILRESSNLPALDLIQTIIEHLAPDADLDSAVVELLRFELGCGCSEGSNEANELWKDVDQASFIAALKECFVQNELEEEEKEHDEEDEKQLDEDEKEPEEY